MSSDSILLLNSSSAEPFKSAKSFAGFRTTGTLECFLSSVIILLDSFLNPRTLIKLHLSYSIPSGLSAMFNSLLAIEL